MLEVLTNLFKDSQSLKKNFLARRWGPEKASSIIIIFIFTKKFVMRPVLRCAKSERVLFALLPNLECLLRQFTVI